MWITASIDAHAKNYSLMHPAADLASRIPAALGAAIETLAPDKANLPIVKTLRRKITSRAHHCKKSTTQATRLIESSSANDGP